MSTSYESAFPCGFEFDRWMGKTRNLSDSLETTILALLTMGHPEPGEVFGWTATTLLGGHTMRRTAAPLRRRGRISGTAK
jgi:hypothetical protein